jgi:hypothetical protein
MYSKRCPELLVLICTVAMVRNICPLFVRQFSLALAAAVVF